MAKTVIGVFENEARAQDALIALQEKGYEPRDYSLLMQDITVDTKVVDMGRNSAISSLLLGLILGAMAGGVLGFASIFFLPSASMWLAQTAVVNALGFTEISASAVTGA